MTSLTRRAFVQGVASAPLAFWLAPRAAAATLRIRPDVASAEGDAMLRIYADAVRRMKSLGEQLATGWEWQWYTHFVKSSTTKSAEIARIFGSTSSTQRTLAGDMWNTCQSHAGQNSNHFLPWHRWYVYQLEQIVRQVSGRPDFSLPYWNYTSGDPALRGVVPRQFRLPDDPVYGPLYRPDRTSLANAGEPIQANQPGDAMDVSDAMARSTYGSVGSVQGFCRAIDAGIHGRIHVLVGNTRNMGAVPWAAQDPLFWVHHANIDRLWASWNRNGGANPTSGSWLDRRFVFADRYGRRISRRLRDGMSASGLGYGYARYVARDGSESGSTSLLAAAAPMRAAPPGNRPEGIGGARPLELGAGTARAAIALDAGRPADALDALDARSGRRTWLVIKDLHAWAQPGVLYHLYLTRRGGQPEAGTYVGAIQFFDAEFHDHGQSPMDMALGENFQSFDVTPLLARLASRPAAAAGVGLELVVVPGGRPAPAARPLVGSVRLVWQ